MLFKKRTLSVMAVVFLLAINVSAVVAAPPVPVTIEVEENLAEGHWFDPETFYASGPAVDNGLVCATGDVVDLEITWNMSSAPFQNLKAHKRFTCDDASGTFDIKMVVKLNKTTRNTTAKWRIVGGTSGYAGLKGHGSLIGISNNPAPGIYDIYDGVVK